MNKMDMRKAAGVVIEDGDTVRKGQWMATVIKAGEKISEIEFHGTGAICFVRNDSIEIVQ